MPKVRIFQDPKLRTDLMDMVSRRLAQAKGLEIGDNQFTSRATNRVTTRAMMEKLCGDNLSDPELYGAAQRLIEFIGDIVQKISFLGEGNRVGDPNFRFDSLREIQQTRPGVKERGMVTTGDEDIWKHRKRANQEWSGLITLPSDVKDIKNRKLTDMAQKRAQTEGGSPMDYIGAVEKGQAADMRAVLVEIVAAFEQIVQLDIEPDDGKEIRKNVPYDTIHLAKNVDKFPRPNMNADEHLVNVYLADGSKYEALMSETKASSHVIPNLDYAHSFRIGKIIRPHSGGWSCPGREQIDGKDIQAIEFIDLPEKQ